MRISVRTIARTAILLVLCLAAQSLKSVSQFITGPIVNTILLLATLSVGLWSGLVISVLSPLLAALIGASPIMMMLPQMFPVVIVGNALLVLSTYFFYRWRQKNGPLIAGMAVGSILKSLFLWAMVSLVVIPLFGTQLKDAVKVTLTAMFSFNQLITAAIGSILAYLIWIPLRKALAKQEEAAPED